MIGVMNKMKSVLISIQPKWCELIVSGKKTVEVRKTRPKIDTPFKCYIYETKALYKPNGSNYFFNGEGKVIGEFVCDEIIEFYEETLAHDELDGNPVESWMMWNMSDNLCEVLHLYEMEDVERCTCLTSAEILSYLHPNMNGYGWHISDLVIYDKPKELSKYRTLCKGQYKDCRKCGNLLSEGCESTGFFESCYFDGVIPLTRPPQSWCYVDSIE